MATERRKARSGEGDPYLACCFVVAFQGPPVGGFSECSGLQVETEFYDYREGGVNGFVHRFAGPTKYPPLVLKQGLISINWLSAWHQMVALGAIVRLNGSIFLRDKQRRDVMGWDFIEAIPVKWTGPELRAESAAVAFESIELAHRGLSGPYPIPVAP